METAENKLQLDVPAEVLATLVEIGEEINASLDLDEVLSRAAALIKRLIDYEVFAVLLLDERTGELYFRFAIGHRPEVVEHWRIPLGKGIVGTVAQTRQPLRVPDVSREPNYINALDTVRSELAVPLLYKGRVIGVLDIQSSRPDDFTRDQQNILTLLASRISIAIENARLYERARRQAESLLLLNEIGRESSSILDLEALLRRAAELVKRVIDYQIFSILLYDERLQAYRRRLTVKYGESIVERHMAVAGEGIIGAAVSLRRPVRVADVTEDPRYIPLNPETRSELAVPMIFQDRVIGVLDLESPEFNYFTEEHEQALSILAAQLAVSIENARLYEKLAREEARMERELQAARRIQGALLPAVPAEDFGVELAARYLSAREVGGDLYDFIRYTPQQLAVMLGDVSGKGTAAALYGAVAIGILRSAAQQKLPPAELLQRLNDLICERRVDGRFMTLTYATWNRAKHKLRIANAGQAQPMLLHGGRCEKIPLTGLPVGIEPGVAYDELAFVLDPGDVLLFYSDGITEATSESGEQFGTERLRDLLLAHAAASAAEIADRIMDAVEDFAGSAALADDRTLVVLKVK
ncbi:MAG: SpoIIE family protein phosphatase [Acidobacteriia bacterium]|jgi:sigma-B regulation protein RsbU (phosphoserine phosphatase)|nr:SpoIIE family protein phosphatase [Terriglobia bacterium]